MAAIEVKEAGTPFENGYRAPACEADGPAQSTLFQPEGYSLWEVEAELGTGAELRWSSQHGDEVLFILDGAMEVDGQICEPKAAAIIEAGVAATARAVTPSKVVHFGPTSVNAPSAGLYGPAPTEGRRVHVARPDDATRVGSDDGPGAVYYADSSCPTCRLAFFEVSGPAPQVVGSHTHSEDEIIRVTSGELRLGRTRVGPGMSVAIPGGYRYGFRTPGAFSFLNYRRDVSTYVAAPGSEPMVEGAAAARRMRSADELG
jgi:mannose-6-phosphate isomerase-like protein (cupin superfamily)